MKVLEVTSFTSFMLAASAGEDSFGIAVVLVAVSFITGGIAYLLERKAARKRVLTGFATRHQSIAKGAFIARVKGL